MSRPEAVPADRPPAAGPAGPGDAARDTATLRRRSARNVRHEARAALHDAVFDDDLLEDADLHCPVSVHDLGRKPSPAARRTVKPGRRSGFKVWKTPFWKRRRAERARRNAVERGLALDD